MNALLQYSRAIVFLLCTFAAQGQGKVGFQNTTPAGIEPFVYALDPTDPFSSVLGGPRAKCAGTAYSVELWWGLRGNPLKPVDGSLTGFRTGSAAGIIVGNSNLRIQGALGGTFVVLQVRAWDNRGGTVGSWADVILDGTVARGQSRLILNYQLSGVDADGVPHVGSGNIADAMGPFGLYIIPEPSAIGIVVLGLAALASNIFAVTPGASFLRHRSPTQWGRGGDDKNRSDKKIRRGPETSEGTESFPDLFASNISVVTPPFPAPFAPSRLRVRHAAVLFLLLTCVSTFGQGQVGYQNTCGLGKEKFVYGLDPNDPTSDLLGGPREKCAGTGYSAELWWGFSGDDLKPVEGSLTTFKSGATAGLINGNSNLPIQGAPRGTKVVLQLRAWDNRGGTVASWADVLQNGSVARGQSQLVTNYELEGYVEGGPNPPRNNIACAGLQSFGLVVIAPEPSVVALAALGALGVGALSLRRRR